MIELASFGNPLIPTSRQETQVQKVGKISELSPNCLIVILSFFRKPQEASLVSKSFHAAVIRCEDNAFKDHKEGLSPDDFLKLLTNAGCTEVMSSSQKNHLIRRMKICADFKLLATKNELKSIAMLSEMEGVIDTYRDRIFINRFLCENREGYEYSQSVKGQPWSRVANKGRQWMCTNAYYQSRETLPLWGCGLKEVPKEIFRQPNLTNVVLSYNKISRFDPELLFHKSLSLLDFTGNKTTLSVPRGVAAWIFFGEQLRPLNESSKRAFLENLAKEQPNKLNLALDEVQKFLKVLQACSHLEVQVGREGKIAVETDHKLEERLCLSIKSDEQDVFS